MPPDRQPQPVPAWKPRSTRTPRAPAAGRTRRDGGTRTARRRRVLRGAGIRAATAALLLGGAAPAMSQGVNWYTVELIVFAHTDASHLDDEVWLHQPGLPPIDESVELVDAAGIALDGEPAAGGSSAPRTFQLVGPSHHRLSGVYDRLQSSPDYRPLLHIAWRQPGLSKRRARHARVQGFVSDASASEGSSTGPRSRLVIDGTVRLHFRRFIHLDADLLYYRDAPPPPSHADGSAVPSPTPSLTGAGAGPPPSSTDAPPSPSRVVDGAAVVVSPLPSESSLAASAAAEGQSSGSPARVSVPGTPEGRRWSADDGPPVAYRMTASRRMRRGELHYLDHPLFGVLIVVTR